MLYYNTLNDITSTFSPAFRDNGVEPPEIICDTPPWLLRLRDIAARKDIPDIGLRLPIKACKVIAGAAYINVRHHLAIGRFKFLLSTFSIAETLDAICQEIDECLSHCSVCCLQKNTLYAAIKYKRPRTMQQVFIALSIAAEKS